MERFKTGMLARSKAGHDFEKVYVIVDADQTYVYLTDGNLRPLDKPKKKKKKHVQIICEEYDIKEADDAKIRRILKEWKKEEEI